MKRNVSGLPQRVDVGRSPPRAGDRQDCPAGRWRGAGDLWRDDGVVHRGRDEIGQTRPGFLSAHRQLPGKNVCRRQDPGRVFQARGPALGEGDADLAAHRPADPAAVRPRVPQRDAGHLHGAEPRSGERPGHRGAGRQFSRADPVGDPVSRADRRLPGRLYRWRVRIEPDARPAAGFATRPHRRRHRRGCADGRIGSQGAVRGNHARRGDLRP